MSQVGELKGTERILDGVLRHMRHGRLIIVYPSGQRRSYGDRSPAVTMRIKSLPAGRLRNPPMFIGESYMHGNIEIDEDQLDTFFSLMGRNPINSPLLNSLGKLPKRQRNQRKTQRKQISHHYDIGNDYYKLWLDKTLTYSCAYFQQPNDSLETAQRQKLTYVLRKLQIKPGQRLLDVGCGWGHLCVQAAKEYGAEVLGITLSHEQLAGARQLAKKKGVADKVRFELMNYQDVPDNQQFDRIVSVGMFEHVGRGNHAIYFQKIRRLLTDDGLSVLHTITEMVDKPASPWIDKYIFPGGHLTSIDNIEKLLAEFRFWSIDRENLWQHYAKTLDIWRQRHQAHRAEIIKMFDEVFYRQQDFWLAGSAATFRYGDTSINQFIFAKNKPLYETYPLTRNYLYK
jgi:cyclopropane-fatty-acyl-phospholipid synthase